MTDIDPAAQFAKDHPGPAQKTWMEEIVRKKAYGANRTVSAENEERMHWLQQAAIAERYAARKLYEHAAQNNRVEPSGYAVNARLPDAYAKAALPRHSVMAESYYRMAFTYVEKLIEELEKRDNSQETVKGGRKTR